MYHVFTDGIDWYLEDRNEAFECAVKFLDFSANVRVYEHLDENNDIDDDCEEGDCILYIGNFPE